jgi:hypothetical protein
MDIPVVIHAPNAEASARAALFWLVDAIFASSAALLIQRTRGRVPANDRIHELKIIDAFGPNPSHPLSDTSVLMELKSLLAPEALIVVTLMTAPPGRQAEAGFSGGFGGGFGGRVGAPMDGGAGFSGGGSFSGFSGGFGGRTTDVGAHAPSYLRALHAAFGRPVRLQVATTLQQMRVILGE